VTPPPSALQRVISDKFSIPFEIYRITTSEFPAMPKLHELNAYYTYDMILDLLEMLDVHYSLNEENVLKQRMEAERESKRRK
jgi:hypothetical protein